MARESETYHGSRGMRLLAQWPESTALWFETMLTAARDVAAAGVPVRLRQLLAMTTLRTGVEAFLEIFDEVARRVVSDPETLVEGISVMLETTGSY